MLHALRSKPSVTGTFKLVPSTLVLMAVQRHKAASKSARPLIRAQQSLPEGGFPTTTLTTPRRSAQAASFNVGQDPFSAGGGDTGVGGGSLHERHALVNVEEKSKESTKMAV